jgi:hypothetical protein
MPARVATALGHPSRDAFLQDYDRRTEAVRAIYESEMRRGQPDPKPATSRDTPLPTR